LRIAVAVAGAAVAAALIYRRVSRDRNVGTTSRY